MNDIPVSDLSKVHALLQERINELVAAGYDAVDVVECSLTVAVANRLKLHGPREVSRGLAVVARYLSDQADELERRAQTEKSRRHGD